LNKSILRLAIPNILSNLSVPLLSSVDTAIVGHLEGTYYLGAIAIGSMIFNFVYWGFGFLRMGTTGLTAQAFGKKDNSEILYAFYRALIIAVSAAFVILIIQSFVAEFSFWIVDASEQVERYARSYYDIRIFAAPATLAIYVFNGWFFGIQNARIPLYLTLISNLINIFANLLFVYSFDMKSDGVALGTVCAQYITLFAALVYFKRESKGFAFTFHLNRLFNLTEIKRFATVNFDIFIRTLLLVFAFSFFTAKSAEYGDTLLAANTILLQFWTILAYGIDGFAFAAESLVGKYFGAKDKKNLIEVIKYIFIWSLSLSFILTLIFYLFESNLISLFTNDEEVIEVALSLMIWTIIAPIINCICYIWDGIFIGTTATSQMRNAMLFCTILIFLPTYYLLNSYLGSEALWVALILFMISRGVTLSLQFNSAVLNRI
jgi:MATE family multidrug resistance protein